MQEVERKIMETQDRLRILSGGCSCCPCAKYKYSFKKTFSDNNRASDGKKAAKIILNTPTLFISHVLGDNRCKCGHLNSNHGR